MTDESISSSVVIDEQTYAITKLPFGKSIELASIFTDMFSSISYDQTGKVSSLDAGAMLNHALKNSSKILSIGLGIPVEKVNQFKDTESALKALDEILKINPIKHLLGKSTSLLNALN